MKHYNDIDYFLKEYYSSNHREKVCRLDSIISDKDCRTCYLYRDLCGNWCGIRDRMEIML